MVRLNIPTYIYSIQPSLKFPKGKLPFFTQLTLFAGGFAPFGKSLLGNIQSAFSGIHPAVRFSVRLMDFIVFVLFGKGTRYGAFKYISLCKAHKFIAEPVLHGVDVVDFTDRHVFVKDFIYRKIQWGAKYAGYSAPASVAFLYVIPYGVGIAVCVIVAMVLRKKGK